jgi:hypothetical protein
MYYFWAFTFGFGFVSSLGPILTQMLSPFNVDQDMSSYIGAVITIAGVISAMLYGVFMMEKSN